MDATARPTPRRALVFSVTPHFALAVIRALAMEGVVCDLVDPRPAEDRRSRHCNQLIAATMGDFAAPSEDFITRVRDHIQAHGIDALVPTDTASSRLLIAHAHRWAPAACFPVPSAETFEQMYDKWSFYHRLLELGLPTPATHRIHHPDQVEALDLGWPVVAKPPSSEGGVGVHVIDDAERLRQHLREHATEDAPLLAQAYKPGEDIGFSFLANHGRLVAWTVQKTAKPGTVRFMRHTEVEDIGRRLVEATGYHGVGHMDLQESELDGSVWCIEMNPRFWGSLNYAVWSGVNFPWLGLQTMAGQADAAGFTPPACDCPFLPWSLGRLKRLGRAEPGAPAPTAATRRATRLLLRDPRPEIYKAMPWRNKPS